MLEQVGEKNVDERKRDGRCSRILFSPANWISALGKMIWPLSGRKTKGTVWELGPLTNGTRLHSAGSEGDSAVSGSRPTRAFKSPP